MIRGVLHINEDLVINASLIIVLAMTSNHSFLSIIYILLNFNCFKRLALILSVIIVITIVIEIEIEIMTIVVLTITTTTKSTTSSPFPGAARLPGAGSNEG